MTARFHRDLTIEELFRMEWEVPQRLAMEYIYADTQEARDGISWRIATVTAPDLAYAGGKEHWRGFATSETPGSGFSTLEALQAAIIDDYTAHT